MEQVKKHGVDIIVIFLSLVAFFAVWLATGDLGIAIALMAVPISFLAAKHYGDVAANKATLAHAEEQARQARIMAFLALINETGRIGDLARHNLDLLADGAPRLGYSAVKMPTVAFETAFFSKEPLFRDLRQDPTTYADLILAVRRYLTEASAINSLVEMRLASVSSDGAYDLAHGLTRKIHDRSSGLGEILDHLRDRLAQELSEARNQ